MLNCPFITKPRIRFCNNSFPSCSTVFDFHRATPGLRTWPRTCSSWQNIPSRCSFKMIILIGASLVAQWLRIRLPTQGTRVRALVREDPTCHRATKPVRHNYWACALEPVCHNYRTRAPRARAPQQEKPPQWEACAPQRRVAPAQQLEKAHVQQRRPNAAKSK